MTLCQNCNRNFSNMTLHLVMSRCGRMQRGKLDKQDEEMIKKYGLEKAIRRRAK